MSASHLDAILAELRAVRALLEAISVAAQADEQPRTAVVRPDLAIRGPQTPRKPGKRG